MNNQIYNQRLLRFAGYLMDKKSNEARNITSTVIITAYEDDERLQYHVQFIVAVFKDLNKVFPKDWTIDENGDPYLTVIEAGATWINGVFDYFNLSPTEFGHLFGVNGFQNIYLYGGAKLNQNSDRNAIALNIIAFVSRRHNENYFRSNLN